MMDKTSQCATPSGCRFHLDGPTRLDKQAAGLLTHADGLSLPRKWASIQRWQDLVEKEVHRILEAYGSTAFEDLPNVRRALLRRNYGPGGQETIMLTTEAEAALLARVGRKGFRRVIRDDDGVNREYLIKHLTPGSGCLEIRLSWYGQA